MGSLTTCRGITKKHLSCRRSIRKGEYCFLHRAQAFTHLSFEKTQQTLKNSNDNSLSPFEFDFLSQSELHKEEVETPKQFNLVEQTKLEISTTQSNAKVSQHEQFDARSMICQNSNKDSFDDQCVEHQTFEQEHLENAMLEIIESFAAADGSEVGNVSTRGYCEASPDHEVMFSPSQGQ